MAEESVSLIPGIKHLLADKGYDSDAIRAFLKERGIKPVIPGKANRKKKIRHDKKAYKGRNVVERDRMSLTDRQAKELRIPFEPPNRKAHGAPPS